MRSPLDAFGVAEKLRVRKKMMRQSSPRCVMVPLQSMGFADIDLPEMHSCPVRAFGAPHWTGMHLGEVNIGKNDPLYQSHSASWGALTHQMFS